MRVIYQLVVLEKSVNSEHRIDISIKASPAGSGRQVLLGVMLIQGDYEVPDVHVKSGCFGGNSLKELTHVLLFDFMYFFKRESLRFESKISEELQTLGIFEFFLFL